jgi:SAM-dependent methyltransferase
MTHTTKAGYDQRIKQELAHFSREYQGHKPDEPLVQHVPPVWQFLEQRVEHLIRQATGGFFLQDFIANFLNNRPAPRMLSLASGPCGLEIDIAGRLQGNYELVCTDLNEQLLTLGMEQAQRKGLHLTSRVADCNKIELEEKAYDLIMAFASLHHFTDFERLFPCIIRALRPGGLFITMDICSRNGYRMWDNTFETVQGIWRLLPEHLKINHTRFGKPHLTLKHENLDYGDQSFECIRSQDILRNLAQYFDPVHYVAYYALCRRFFDPMYGPNYNLDNPLDRAIVDFVWELDQHLLSEGRLAPETFFGVFAPRTATTSEHILTLRSNMLRDDRAGQAAVHGLRARLAQITDRFCCKTR